MDIWSPKYSPSPPLHRTRSTYRAGPAGKGPRGLPVGELVLVDPFRVPQRRSNSLDDDSGSSGGAEADLLTSWTRQLTAVRSQRGARRDFYLAHQMDGDQEGLTKNLVNSGGLTKDLINFNEGVLATDLINCDQTGLKEDTKLNRRICGKDMINSVEKDMSYQSEQVRLPSRKKSTTWCRTRRTKALLDRTKVNIPPRGVTGSYVLGRSMSDSPCYMQARNIVNNSKSITTRSQEDFPVTTEQSVIEDLVPPLPPRDYPVKVRRNEPPPPLPPSLAPPIPPHQRQNVEIHPIFQDGKKVSDTHYFLLENKQPRYTLNLPPNPEDYLNISSANNDSTTLWSDAAAAQLNFGPTNLGVNSPGQRGVYEGLQRVLWKTGFGWCLGRDRKLRRSQSDSERHLLTLSSESGLDAGDRSSIDSAPCCVETGYANRGLDTSNDEQSMAGSVNEYSNRDLDTSGSDQSLTNNNRYKLTNRGLDTSNYNLSLANTANGYANRELDTKNADHSSANRTEICTSNLIDASNSNRLLTSNGYSDSNGYSNSYSHHARNRSVNDQLLFNNGYADHELNALNTSNNVHLVANSTNEYSNRTLDISNDYSFSNNTYNTSSGLNVSGHGFRHTNHPRLDSTRAWQSLGEQSATNPGWTLEDGRIKQDETWKTDRQGCYNGTGGTENMRHSETLKTNIPGYCNRTDNTKDISRSEAHRTDQLGCCNRTGYVKSCACTKGSHCNCGGENQLKIEKPALNPPCSNGLQCKYGCANDIKTKISSVNPSCSGSYGLQGSCEAAWERVRLVDELMKLQVGTREECLQSLIDTRYDLDRAADRLLDGKASCV